MASSYPLQSGPGNFVVTTNIWDVQEIYSTEVTSPEFKELLVRLYQNLNNMALVLNNKESGFFTLTEFVNSQMFFPNPALTSSTPQTPTYRQVFRKVVNFGALPAAGTKSEPHGLTLTDGFTFTHIYATASNPTGRSYIPIPYASSVAADIIELDVDNVNVNITVASDKSAYTSTYVVLEYIKQ